MNKNTIHVHVYYFKIIITRAKSTSHFKHHVMKEIQMYAFQFLKIRNYHTICILNLELTENIDGN